MKFATSPLNKAIHAVVFAFALTSGSQTLFAQASQTEFDLVPNAKFVDCLGVPGGPTPQLT